MDVPQESRAPRNFRNERVRLDTFSLLNVAVVIDFVPHHDPRVGGNILRPRVTFPMGSGDHFHPLHPHGVVHVPELIDVLWACGKCEVKCVAHRCIYFLRTAHEICGRISRSLSLSCRVIKADSCS